MVSIFFGSFDTILDDLMEFVLEGMDEFVTDEELDVESLSWLSWFCNLCYLILIIFLLLLMDVLVLLWVGRWID